MLRPLVGKLVECMSSALGMQEKSREEGAFGSNLLSLARFRVATSAQYAVGYPGLRLRRKI